MKKGEKYAIIKALEIFVHFNQRIFDFERIFALYGAPLWEEFMNELEKIVKQTAETLGISFCCYAENTRPQNIPTCDKSFEKMTDDGTHTFFRFTFKNAGYIGVIAGATQVEKNYAALLPTYLESSVDRENELSKTEYLKKILLGECSSLGVYKYATKYAVRGAACFVIVLRVPKMMKETLSLIAQYCGNTMDVAVPVADDTCALVRFLDKTDGEYQSSVDYAEFLAQSIKEELGLDVQAGIGPTVRELKDLPISHARAEDALRYADVFGMNEKVHSYRKFVLLKLLEDVPPTKLAQYLSDFTDESFREVFEEDEMLTTAEEFLLCSQNVNETARNLYVHRNTLLYRLEKIEKATGLNIRSFPDAVSFRVLTVIYRLLGK